VTTTAASTETDATSDDEDEDESSASHCAAVQPDPAMHKSRIFFFCSAETVAVGSVEHGVMARAHLDESWKHSHSFPAAPPAASMHWPIFNWHAATPALNFAAQTASTVLAAVVAVAVAVRVKVVIIVVVVVVVVAAVPNPNSHCTALHLVADMHAAMAVFFCSSVTVLVGATVVHGVRGLRHVANARLHAQVLASLAASVVQFKSEAEQSVTPLVYLSAHAASTVVPVALTAVLGSWARATVAATAQTKRSRRQTSAEQQRAFGHRTSKNNKGGNHRFDAWKFCAFLEVF
jgi:hypothetical protein